MAKRLDEASEQSISRLIDRIHQAFYKEFERGDGRSYAWVKEVYEDYVIANFDESYFKIPYTIKNDEVTFSSREGWDEVERKWVSIKESAQNIFRPAMEQLVDLLVGEEVEVAESIQLQESSVRILEAKGKTGKEWEVTIIGPETTDDLVEIDGVEFIRSKNGRLYLASALEESVELWDGVKVYDNHLTNEEFEQKQGMRSVANEWIGVLVKPFWDKVTKSVKATLKVIDEAVMKKLKNADEAGVLDAIGLSIDALGTGRQAKVGDVMVQVIEKLTKAISVDVVADPAAGGKFSRMLASGG
jgi:hypothetical protein